MKRKKEKNAAKQTKEGARDDVEKIIDGLSPERQEKIRKRTAELMAEYTNKNLTE